MSLAEKLKEASSSKPTSFLCKLGVILTNGSLSEQDSTNLKAVLSIPNGQPRPVSDFELSRVLSEENIHISPSTIERHRKSLCSCGRPTK